jgi:hypothetical protein
MMIRLTAVLFLASLVSTKVSNITWNLENYNGWNVPFAKTVEIYNTDSVGSEFPKSQYLLSVDPSAYFTVVFVESII